MVRDPLGDVSNVKKCRKRLSNGTIKEYPRKDVIRKTISIVFYTEGEKEEFERVWSEAQDVLKISSSKAVAVAADSFIQHFEDLSKQPSIKRRRMETETEFLNKRNNRAEFRKTIYTQFKNEDEKQEFENKWSTARSGNYSSADILYKGITSHLGKKAEYNDNLPEDAEETPNNCQSVDEANETSENITTEANNNASIKETPDETFFIGDLCAIEELVKKIQHHVSVCNHPLEIFKSRYAGHVLEIVMSCENKHRVFVPSSRKVGEYYTANIRCFLAFLSSGMLHCQYKKFSLLAKIGSPNARTFSKIKSQIAAAVDVEVEMSTAASISEEISKSDSNGICMQTDSRHAQRKNSFYADIVALGLHTHKVLNLQIVTKDDENCSQKHEVLGTKRLYNYFEGKNIKIAEHIHDRNLSVNKLVREKGNVKNSNDRWHVAKAVMRDIQKLTKGYKKNIGVSWHPQLRDKGAPTRNHFYWAMDNCGGDTEKLKQYLVNVVEHFKNNHAKCHEKAKCKEDGYALPVDVITESSAAALLETFIKQTVVYKNPLDYIYSRDTFYVESFNNTCLVYLDKRIRYRQLETYKLRSGLALLDWNNNVGRLGKTLQCEEKNISYTNKNFRHIERMYYNIIRSSDL